MSLFFFFNDTATTEIYTLSLHDALPISGTHDHKRHRNTDPGRRPVAADADLQERGHKARWPGRAASPWRRLRSEEHTSELQSRQYLVCRLLLEKKKNFPPSYFTCVAY